MPFPVAVTTPDTPVTNQHYTADLMGIPIPESHSNKWAQRVLIAGAVFVTPVPFDDMVVASYFGGLVKISSNTAIKSIISGYVQTKTTGGTAFTDLVVTPIRERFQFGSGSGIR